MPVSVVLPDENNLCLAVARDRLIKAQQSDSTLATCLSASHGQENSVKPVAYLFDDGAPLRKWSSVPGRECDVITYVVVPKKYCF